MAFFAELPPEPPPPEPVRHEIPPWVQPPRDEIPIAVAAARRLGGAPGVVLHLQRFDVYSTGVGFELRLDIRRDDVDDPSVVDTPQGHRQDRQIRLGVELADGTSCSTAGAEGWRFSLGSEVAEPAYPQLSIAGGRGGGDPHRWVQHFTAWLWPRPPDGPLTLYFVSDVFGIEEGSTTLDVRTDDWGTGITDLWGP